LAGVRRLATREGWRHQHVQAIIVSIDQYAEAALGNREFFSNKPCELDRERRTTFPEEKMFAAGIFLRRPLRMFVRPPSRPKSVLAAQPPCNHLDLIGQHAAGIAPWQTRDIRRAVDPARERDVARRISIT
jgi:hypothetical protein